MQWFQDWELHKIEELFRRLQVLRKCTEDEDKLLWKVSKSGNFLVNLSILPKSWMECLFLKSHMGLLDIFKRIFFKLLFIFCLGGCLGKVSDLGASKGKRLGFIKPLVFCTSSKELANNLQTHCGKLKGVRNFVVFSLWPFSSPPFSRKYLLKGLDGSLVSKNREDI